MRIYRCVYNTGTNIYIDIYIHICIYICTHIYFEPWGQLPSWGCRAAAEVLNGLATAAPSALGEPRGRHGARSKRGLYIHIYIYTCIYIHIHIYPHNDTRTCTSWCPDIQTSQLPKIQESKNPRTQNSQIPEVPRKRTKSDFVWNFGFLDFDFRILDF